MNAQQMIREFRRHAREIGMVLDVECTRKAIYVTCGDRRIKLSSNSRAINHAPQYFKKLGLGG